MTLCKAAPLVFVGQAPGLRGALSPARRQKKRRPERPPQARVPAPLLLLLLCPLALALNPALDVSQYAHQSWKFRDGFTQGEIFAMAQTPDGYLWLGTSFGLYRFDGITPALWQPPNQPLPSNQVLSLLAA